MTQPPPMGRTAGTPNAEFGATTVSGAPVHDRPAGLTPDAPPLGGQHRPGGPDGNSGPGASGDRTPTGPQSTAPTGPQTGPQRASRGRGPRRARLQVRHINPMTVLRFSSILAVALFFVWMIVVGVLYGVLDAAGVVQNINDTVLKINVGSNAPVTAGVVFGGAAIIGVVNIVLFIALSTIGSVIYNLCADLVGGVEITLSER